MAEGWDEAFRNGDPSADCLHKKNSRQQSLVLRVLQDLTPESFAAVCVPSLMENRLTEISS